MLKYENTAQIGDTIKAFDFQPVPGRPDRFVIGRVVVKGLIQPEGYLAYTIAVTEDHPLNDRRKIENRREGADVFVPFQLSMLEWDGRVMLVRRANAIAECAEERADMEGTDPADEREADQDHAAYARSVSCHENSGDW